jgi:hypothetical protein
MYAKLERGQVVSYTRTRSDGSKVTEAGTIVGFNFRFEDPAPWSVTLADHRVVELYRIHYA